MDTKLFLIPVVLLVLVVTEVDNRNFLYRQFSEEDLKGYHSPFVPLICCIVFFVVCMFLFPNHNNDYQELQEKYDELSASYDDLSSTYYDYSSTVSLAYDKILPVKAYFLGWEDSSKEDAEQSLHEFCDLIYPGEW